MNAKNSKQKRDLSALLNDNLYSLQLFGNRYYECELARGISRSDNPISCG